jgi:hypothetical protein
MKKQGGATSNLSELTEASDQSPGNFSSYEFDASEDTLPEELP